MAHPVRQAILDIIEDFSDRIFTPVGGDQCFVASIQLPGSILWTRSILLHQYSNRLTYDTKDMSSLPHKLWFIKPTRVGSVRIPIDVDYHTGTCKWVPLCFREKNDCDLFVAAIKMAITIRVNHEVF